MSQKLFLFTSLLISSFFFSCSTWASVTNCDGSLARPCIVNDAEDSAKVKHWRTAHMMYKEYKGNTSGLKHMWVSASGAVSIKGFKTIAKEIEKATDNKAKKMIVLDLRQESHAFLNKDGITLTTTDNWINKGKSYQQTLADEQSWIQTFTDKGTIAQVLTPDQFKMGNYTKGNMISVKAIASEKNVVEQFGFEYVRLTVSDHMRPLDDDVDRFVQLVRNLPADVWLHIHCRGGDGRSTTFFAMYDMLRNADTVSFNDIIQRQASVKPHYDLSKTCKNPDMAKYYEERYQFLMHFYQFASAAKLGYRGTWQEWVNTHLVKG